MEKSMKKHIISRNVRFWGGYMEENFLLVIGIGVVYALFMSFLISEDMSGVELFALRASYVVMMEGILVFVQPLAYPTCNLPLVLSFGSGRTEAVVGMQVSNLLTVGQNLLIVVAAERIARGMEAGAGMELLAHPGLVFAAAAGILLAVAAIGQFGTALILKYGGKGMAVYIIVFVLAVFAGVLAVVFLVGSRQVDDAELISVLTDTHVLQRIKGAVGVLLTVDAALYAAGFLVLKRTVMQYEVRM